MNSSSGSDNLLDGSSSDLSAIRRRLNDHFSIVASQMKKREQALPPAAKKVTPSKEMSSPENNTVSYDPPVSGKVRYSEVQELFDPVSRNALDNETFSRKLRRLADCRENILPLVIKEVNTMIHGPEGRQSLEAFVERCVRERSETMIWKSDSELVNGKLFYSQRSILAWIEQNQTEVEESLSERIGFTLKLIPTRAYLSSTITCFSIELTIA